MLYTRAHREIAMGRFDDAERLADEALHLGDSIGQADAATYYHASIANIRMLQGRYSEALPICERFQRSMPFLAGLAWVLAEVDRPDEARAILDRLQPEGFACIPRDHTWLFTLAFLSRACVSLRESRAADELYPLLLPLASEVAAVHTVWVGPVAADLGLLATCLGRYDQANAHFSEAVQMLERIGSPASLTTTQLEWCRMLLARRAPQDEERARELLGVVLNSARELELLNVERRAVELLGHVS